MSFFEVFSAYYNNNSSISPSKNNSTESHILLEPIQIPPGLIQNLKKSNFQRTTTIIRVNPSKNNSTESQNLLEIPQIPPAINRISLPSQSTAPEESLAPYICGLDSLRGRLFACGKFIFTLHRSGSLPPSVFSEEIVGFLPAPTLFGLLPILK